MREPFVAISFVDRPFGCPADMVTLDLPVPPSVNAAYGNRRNIKGQKRGRGRFKTKVYEKWLIQADASYMLQKRGLPKIAGKLIVEIKLPATVKGDASNRIKVLEDYLVSRKITGDDRDNWKVSIERDDALTEGCRVTLRAA